MAELNRLYETEQWRIYDAIDGGEAQKIDKLLEGDRDLVEYVGAQGSWIWYAAAYSDMNTVKHLHQTYGLDVNANHPYDQGNSLWAACEHGNAPAVRYLLSAGAVLDQSTPTFDALFAAVSNGSADIVAMLLDAGARNDVFHPIPLSEDPVNASDFARLQGKPGLAVLIENYFAGD